MTSLIGRDQDDPIATGFVKSVQLRSRFVGHDRFRAGMVAGDPEPSHPTFRMTRERKDTGSRS